MTMIQQIEMNIQNGLNKISNEKIITSFQSVKSIHLKTNCINGEKAGGVSKTWPLQDQ